MAVACSGGRDSIALLHATLHAAADSGLTVLALHVNHGLSPNADAWQRQLSDQCRRWARKGHDLHFVAARIESQPAAGDSIEAWARAVRHTALQAMAKAHGASVLLLAHHRRDQAETLLLQALRGAGLAGLSAMPAQDLRDGVLWARPWLKQPREAIEAYVRKHRLRWIDDESNHDPRLARNRLRLQVWPALMAAFPDAEVALAQASSWAQEAHVLLEELAGELAPRGVVDGRLRIADWARQTPARQSLLLRHWLRHAMGEAAPATLVQRLLRELPGARNGAEWPARQGRVWREADALCFGRSSEPEAERPAVVRESTLAIRRAGTYALPGWHGRLRVERVREGGVPLAWLGQVALKPREGGERFQAGIGRPARSLKKQFQSAGIGEHERQGPLIFSGGLLVFVPGLGIDARVLAIPGQPQVALHWVRDGASTPAG